MKKNHLKNARTAVRAPYQVAGGRSHKARRSESAEKMSGQQRKIVHVHETDRKHWKDTERKTRTHVHRRLLPLLPQQFRVQSRKAALAGTSDLLEQLCARDGGRFKSTPSYSLFFAVFFLCFRLHLLQALLFLPHSE